MCHHKACFSAKSGGLEGTGALSAGGGLGRTWTQGGQGHDHSLEANQWRKLVMVQIDFLPIRMSSKRLKFKRINREWAKRGRCGLLMFMKDNSHKFTREEKKNLTFHSMLMTSPSATLEAASQKILGNKFYFCVWLIVRGLRFTLLIIYINYLSLKLGFNLGRCICVPTHAFTKWRSAKKTYLVWYFQLFLEIINASNSTHQIISSLLLLSFKTPKEKYKIL